MFANTLHTVFNFQMTYNVYYDNTGLHKNSIVWEIMTRKRRSLHTWFRSAFSSAFFFLFSFFPCSTRIERMVIHIWGECPVPTAFPEAFGLQLLTLLVHSYRELTFGLYIPCGAIEQGYLARCGVWQMCGVHKCVCGWSPRECHVFA